MVSAGTELTAGGLFLFRDSSRMLTWAGVVLTLIRLGPVLSPVPTELLRVLVGNVARAVPAMVLRALLGNVEMPVPAVLLAVVIRALLKVTDEGRPEEAGSGSGAGVSRIF